MKKISLRKNGGFYCAYGNDCYILNYLFDYKITDDRVGFPTSAYEKVVKILEQNNINYESSTEIQIAKRKTIVINFLNLERENVS